jgi:LacI family transcriptional regulator
MARVSIKHIAEKLGVSNATVSLVLNGKAKNGRVSEELIEKIKRTAEEMNYLPNMAARSLRTGKSKTIGLIVADISNPFFAKLARYIENAAEAMNYQVMFGSSDESGKKFEKLVNVFIEKSVDGIIIAAPADSENIILQVDKYGIPIVLVDRAINSIPVSSVQIDNEGAAYALTNHLIGMGCKRIGFMSYNMRLSNIKGRFEGYKKALTDAGITFNPKLARSVRFERFDEEIRRELEELLNNDIDSIVFATNRVGLQSLLILKKMGKVEDLKFVSIDNPDEYKISGIPMTCIEQPIEEMSRRALEILCRKIIDPSYKIIENVTLQTSIL